MKRLTWALVAAGKDWVEDKAPRLAAALSYYTVFSLPPLLVMLVGIAGLVFDADMVRDRLVGQIAGLVGEDSARLLDSAITEAEITTGSGGAVALGFAVLLFGAAGVFGQLQDALNTIWEVEPRRRRGVSGLVRTRLLSLGAVAGSGFLLLVSLAVSAVVGVLVDNFGRFEAVAPFLVLANIVVSLLVITAVFALIFKVLPDRAIGWRDVWVGALLTAALFVAGKFAIGFYLGTADIGSAYGAAGSLIVVLVWIYYSALILFFGAEFTQAWSQGGRHRHTLRPEADGPSDQERSDLLRSAEREPSPVAVIAALAAAWLFSRWRRRHP